LVAVYKNAQGEFYLKDQVSWSEVNHCELIPAFENGALLNEVTLAEIRKRLDATI